MNVYTTQEVADLLGKSRYQLMYAMKQKQIPSPAMQAQHYRLFTDEQVAQIREYFDTRKPTWRDAMPSVSRKEENV